MKRRRLFQNLILTVILSAGMLLYWNAIAEAATDGMMSYYDSGATNTPRYRTWDGSNWSSEGSATSVGADNGRWHVLKSCPKRNEKILGILDNAQDVNVQVWDGTSWDNLQEVTTATGTTTKRAFDIAYEQSSGDAIVVYADSADPDLPYYRVWNGSSWSSASQVATIGTGTVQWIGLASKPGADEIILVTQDSNDDIYAQVWSGSSWGNALALETATQATAAQCFDVAYEQSTGEGLVVWIDGALNTPEYIEWTGSWGTPGAASNHGSVNTRWVKLAAKPGDDDIIMATLDELNDINVEIWSGSSWGNLQEVETGAPGYTKRYFDVAYESSSGEGIIVWSDNTSIPKYRTWTGSWGTEASCSDVSATVHWIVLASDPDTDDIMLLTSDDADLDVNVQKWGGSSWGSVTEVETSSSNSYECFALSYDQYLSPIVTSVSGSQSTAGDGKVTVQFTINDANNDDTCEALVDYDVGGGYTKALALSEVDGDTTATYGDPKVENDDPYQIGNASGYLTTSSGANTVTTIWLSATDAGSADTDSAKVRVTPYDGTNVGSAVESSSFTVDNVDPSGLASFTSSAQSTTGITWSWTACTSESHFSHYEIWYDDAATIDRGASDTEWDNDNDSNLATMATTSTEITGLNSSTTYYAKIWAVDDYGNEITVAEASATTQTPVNPTVAFTTGFPAQKTDGTGTVDISMDVTDDNADNCKVRMWYAGPSDTDPGTYTGDPTLLESASTVTATVTPKPNVENDDTYQIGTTTPIKTTATNTVTFDWDSNTDLSTGDGTYWVKLIANDGTEDGNAVTKSLTIDNVAPVGLASLKADSATSTSITFTWTACTSETNFNHYEIWYDTTSGISQGSDTETEWDNDNDTNLATMSTTSTTITGLASGNIYYAKIWAVDDYGNEQTIAEITVGLANLQESESKSSSSKLTWTAFTPSGSTFDHYEIWYGTIRADVEGRTGTASEWDNNNDVDLATRATTSTTIIGLSSGTTYYMQLWGVYSGSTEVSTPVITITTPTVAEEVKSTAEKWGCFIATAAYSGESGKVRKWESERKRLQITDHRLLITDHPINTLRQFRNEHLLTNAPGRAFVSTYYKVSPPIADFIYNKEPLKAITRTYLRPVVWGAKRILKSSEYEPKRYEQ